MVTVRMNDYRMRWQQSESDMLRLLPSRPPSGHCASNPLPAWKQETNSEAFAMVHLKAGVVGAWAMVVEVDKFIYLPHKSHTDKINAGCDTKRGS